MDDKRKHWARCAARAARRDQAGQSLVIMAVAFVALLVIIGLAIDLALMYIERIQLGRACDAAALAAAQELPFEEFAVRRAIEYLQENGYDPSNTELVVTGPANAAALSWPAPGGSRGKVAIDTERFEDDQAQDPDNSADKIMVYGQINVPMNFMRLIGFTSVPVEAKAVAENVSNVDVAIVYDRSGSMGEDTRCYGCYEKSSSQEYPQGTRRYLPYDADICTAQEPVVDGSYVILAAEAEYYTYSTSYVEHNYHRRYYVYPNTYWTLQRVEDSQASGYRHEVNDMRGAHLMHSPHGGTWPVHNSVTSAAPRLDYDFTFPSGGPWYVWMRSQCGAYSGSCKVHWGVDKSVKGTNDSTDSGYGGYGYGSYGNRWVWIRLGQVSFSDTPAVHQINFWGGGSGFRLDKIVVTTNPEGQSGYTDNAPSFIRRTTPTWSEVQGQEYQTYYANSRYGGPPDTQGRTGFACHKCNPIYGLRVNAGCSVGDPAGPGQSCEDLNGNGRVDRDEICDNTMDDLFDDKQPIRFSQEAAKNFVKRMKARFDQLSYVTYSSNASITRELNCIKQRGYPPASYGVGVYDIETGTADNAWTWCFDHRTGTGGYQGNYDTSTTDGSIMYAIDLTTPSGSTNIADALMDGISALSTQSGHYGRPNAASVIVLMTDGQANQYPNNTCWAGDLWEPPSSSSSEDKAKDCVIYYANDARDNNIIVYSIGLGAQADNALLQEVSDRTGGVYFYAPKPEDLDEIFQQIADQIFLRLVQ